jgi:capsid protein
VAQAGDDDTTDPLLPEKVEPGIIEELRDGKDVKFASPPGVSGYGEYASMTLHQIATGYGIPYSVLTGDLRQVNFSSGRMGLMTFNRNVTHWQHNMMIPQLCNPVWAWFMEALQVMGLINDPVAARWSAPRRELTDPAREIPAIRDSIRSGLTPFPEAIRQMGFDPDDFIDQARDFNDQLDAAGLVFDSDPRKVSAAGLSQPTPAEPAPSTTGEPDDEEN